MSYDGMDMGTAGPSDRDCEDHQTESPPKKFDNKRLWNLYSSMSSKKLLKKVRSELASGNTGQRYTTMLEALAIQGSEKTNSMLADIANGASFRFGWLRSKYTPGYLQQEAAKKILEKYQLKEQQH